MKYHLEVLCYASI